jgi:hypothetical protein
MWRFFFFPMARRKPCRKQLYLCGNLLVGVGAMNF